MIAQPDLFGDDDAAETRRYQDALTCLADACPTALELLIGVRKEDRGEIRQGKSGDWAYSSRREGFYFERVETWGGWCARPCGLITWSELDELTAADPRVAQIRAWSDSLTVIDAWKGRYRPYEMWPNPETWHPSHIQADHDRPGWSGRLHAWQQTIAVYRDAAATLR